MYSGGVVAYKSKTQTVTATSSTEAEFIAAVLAAKCAKWLRAILTELGANDAATAHFTIASYVSDGDMVRIDFQDSEGRSIFGAIEQKVVTA